ncbi:MAG: Hsp20 family protein, partial [Candidatus Poseidoniia archaeon]
ELEVIIKVETDARNYYKRLSLRSKVIPDSAKATYTNGILDLVLKKQESEKSQGTRVKVD